MRMAALSSIWRAGVGHAEAASVSIWWKRSNPSPEIYEQQLMHPPNSQICQRTHGQTVSVIHSPLDLHLEKRQLPLLRPPPTLSPASPPWIRKLMGGVAKNRKNRH